MTTTMNKKAIVAPSNGDKCEGALYFIGNEIVFSPMLAIELLVRKGMEKAAANRYVIALKRESVRRGAYELEQEAF